jgi:hypothetical protein
MYAIASHAIWAVGATPEAALADYIDWTGDDTVTLDTLATRPDGGLFIAPMTPELAAVVDARGGDLVFWYDEDKRVLTNR